jgi:hypothetical protein
MYIDSYVSDMLAWLHQSLAGERDFFTTIITSAPPSSLLDDENPTPNSDINNDSKRTAGAAGNDTSNGSNGSPEDQQNDAAAIADLLASVFEGIARPLKSRIEQALTTQPTPVIIFKLVNILDFYAATIGNNKPLL